MYKCPLCINTSIGFNNNERVLYETHRHFARVHADDKIEKQLMYVWNPSPKCTVCEEKIPKADMIAHFVEKHPTKAMKRKVLSNNSQDNDQDYSQHDYAWPDAVNDSSDHQQQTKPPQYIPMEEVHILFTENEVGSEVEGIEELRREFLADDAIDDVQGSSGDEKIMSGPVLRLSSIIGTMANEIDELASAITTFTLQDYFKQPQQTLCYLQEADILQRVEVAQLRALVELYKLTKNVSNTDYKKDWVPATCIFSPKMEKPEALATIRRRFIRELVNKVAPVANLSTLVKQDSNKPKLLKQIPYHPPINLVRFWMVHPLISKHLTLVSEKHSLPYIERLQHIDDEEGWDSWRNSVRQNHTRVGAAGPETGLNWIESFYRTREYWWNNFKAAQSSPKPVPVVFMHLSFFWDGFAIFTRSTKGSKSGVALAGMTTLEAAMEVKAGSHSPFYLPISILDKDLKTWVDTDFYLDKIAEDLYPLAEGRMLYSVEQRGPVLVIAVPSTLQADSPAKAEWTGFKSPSGNNFCDVCHVKIEDYHNVLINSVLYVPRDRSTTTCWCKLKVILDPSLSDILNHIDQPKIKEMLADATKFGLKRASSFWKFPGFLYNFDYHMNHILPLDGMHLFGIGISMTFFEALLQYLDYVFRSKVKGCKLYELLSKRLIDSHQKLNGRDEDDISLPVFDSVETFHSNSNSAAKLKIMKIAGPHLLEILKPYIVKLDKIVEVPTRLRIDAWLVYARILNILWQPSISAIQLEWLHHAIPAIMSIMFQLYHQPDANINSCNLLRANMHSMLHVVEKIKLHGVPKANANWVWESNIKFNKRWIQGGHTNGVSPGASITRYAWNSHVSDLVLGNSTFRHQVLKVIGARQSLRKIRLGEILEDDYEMEEGWERQQVSCVKLDPITTFTKGCFLLETQRSILFRLHGIDVYTRNNDVLVRGCVAEWEGRAFAREIRSMCMCEKCMSDIFAKTCLKYYKELEIPKKWVELNRYYKRIKVYEQEEDLVYVDFPFLTW